MFDDSFKSRYTTLPFATYKRNVTSSNITGSDPILHNHREVELIAITDGKAEVYVNGETSVVSKGDILVIAPYKPDDDKDETPKKLDFGALLR